MSFEIAGRKVGDAHPTYFVADVAANHDGQMSRAVDLIGLAKEAGADAAKFQNFQAPKIVSDYGFRHEGGKVSHQATWKKSVVEVYADASLPFDWTPTLKEACDKAGIHYFSSPYDFEAIDMLADFVPAYKIGSGDIDWLEALERIADKGKPILLATGAATLADVDRAVEFLLGKNVDLCLMQCNTNYTGAVENFNHVHLNVLRSYRVLYQDVVLGLSDHTPGHSAVLGAVALGARVIEKHFTDDNTREGPDHPFALDPVAWREMVDRTRELESALGSSHKFVTDNEQETKYIQRRCVRAARDLSAGEVLRREDLDVLRPFADGAIRPHEIGLVVGHKVAASIPAGAAMRWIDVVE